jgi:hypothetical protein
MTNYDKWQTRPLVREGAPYQQTRNRLTVMKIWSYAPDGCFIPRQTGRLIVGRNMTLTFELKWVVEGERERSESSAVEEDAFGWRLIVSYCKWLWLRQIVTECVNISSHPIQNPLLSTQP